MKLRMGDLSIKDIRTLLGITATYFQEKEPSEEEQNLMIKLWAMYLSEKDFSDSLKVTD